MKDKTRNIVASAAFVVFILGFFIMCLIKPADEISVSERRKLAQFPEYSTKALLSGEMADSFEDYAVDQFPFREQWRKIKAVLSRDVFFQKDNNGIYVENGYVSKIEYPLNERSVINAAAKFNQLYDKYFKDGGGKAYFALVPDKNYFLAEEGGYPHIDYQRLKDLLGENLEDMSFIDLFDTLSVDDYYKTDTHWSQDKIVGAAMKLANEMGVGQYMSGEYDVEEVYPFYGVYTGQSALNLPPDTLYYLTNDVISSASVYDYESGETRPVYDESKLEGFDKYELFLSGSVPLITITNERSQSGKDLVIFRDSFGSSMAPLLIECYDTVTLVDIRYIQSDVLGDYIDFAGSDVLFLYNSSVLNNSVMLR